ncbi:hypothetical protein A8P48_21680 [Yersinia pestis]|nr:hypothetical protein A8P48_21680 [Yersinia pestis]
MWMVLFSQRFDDWLNEQEDALQEKVLADIDNDIVNAKRQLGLVPQEFNFNPFETVLQIVITQPGTTV